MKMGDELTTEIDVAHLRQTGDIADLPTLANLEASYKLSPGLTMPDSAPFSEQPTWITPIVRDLPSSEQPKLFFPVVRVMQKVIKAGTQISGAQDYASLIRDLVKSSGIYAIASLASPLVALVLAPFLTHSLSRSDFGALVVLNTAIALVTGITQLGLISAVFRAYNYDYESRRDRLGVLSTTVVLLSLTSLPITLLVAMTAPWLASLLLANSSFGTPVKIAALVVLMQNLSLPGFAWLRAEKRAMFFSMLSILNLLVTLGGNVILVGAAHMGINGALLATGAGYAVVVICTLPLILLRAGLASRLNIARNLLSFGTPLVFNGVSFWVLQLSDRYLLSRLGSLTQTASYGVAYNLGGILNIVILSPFILAWPTAMFAIAKRKDALQVFQLVFRWFSMVLLLAAFALTLIAVAVLDLLFPPSYHSAAPIIPIISVSMIIYGVYYIFTIGVGVRRKTWFVSLAMTLAALINVGCNLVLIPFYGSMGAALSTLIAYVLLALIMYVVNQRVYPIPFEIHIFAMALLVGIAVYAGSSFLAQHQTIYGVCAIYVGSTVLYGGFLVLLVLRSF